MMRYLPIILLMLLLQGCHYYTLKSFNLVRVDAASEVKKNSERARYIPVTIIHQEKNDKHYRYFLSDMSVDSSSITGTLGHYLYADTVYCENFEISEYYYNEERELLKEREREFFNIRLLDRGSRRIPIENTKYVEQTHIYLKDTVPIEGDSEIVIHQADIKTLHIMYWSKRGIFLTLLLIALPIGLILGILAIIFNYSPSYSVGISL